MLGSYCVLSRSMSFLKGLKLMPQMLPCRILAPSAETISRTFCAWLPIEISMGNQAQKVPLMVSADGAKILQGNIWGINFNPFKKDIDRLKTQYEPSMGTPGATVVLVEFSDFQCPYCKEEATMLRKNLLAEYPAQTRLYFKTFPLVSLHPWAKPAAIASRCVFRQDAPAFW